MKNLEIKGKWWLPEKPSNKINGMLTMTPEENPTLDLDGSFRESEPPGNPSEREFEKIDIICGDSSNGKEVTLQGCRIFNIKVHLNRSRGKITSTRMLIEKIFLGNHFLEEPKFKLLIVEFPYLFEWMNKKTFNVSLEPGKRGTIDFTCWSKECSIDSIKVLFCAENKTLLSSESYHIDKNAFVKIENEDEIPYSQLEKYLWEINNFLDFGTGKDTFPCKIKGLKENDSQEIEIFFQAKNDYQGKDLVIASFSPLPLQVIEPNFEKILKKWFEKRKSLEWVFSLYFGYRRNKNSYLNDNFLAIVRALEVYYNCTVKETYLSEEDYKKEVEEPLIKAIKSLNNTDKGLKESLKNKLKYGNEKSLKNKLKILYKKKEDLCNRLGISEELLNKVKNTRNYFTHYAIDESDILSDKETLKATIKLKVMLELFILEEIGLSEQEKRFVNFYKDNFFQ